MKKMVLFALWALVVLCGCSTPAEEAVIPNPELELESYAPVKTMTEEDIHRDIMPVINSFLDAQYNYLIGKDKTPQWDVIEGSDVLLTQLNSYKERKTDGGLVPFTDYKRVLVWSNEKFDGYRTGSFKQNGDFLTISNALEMFTLYYTYINEYQESVDSHSNGNLYYDGIILQFIQGKWKIHSWEEHGFLGEGPRWYVKPKEELHKVSQIVPQTSKYETRSSAMCTYNRGAARDYAYRHVFNPSSNYYDYSYYGDCTNFVSQCLEAGGLAQVKTGRHKWYHKQGGQSTNDRSPSWTGAKEFQRYLANSGRIVSGTHQLSDLNIGDVVQFEDRGSAYHTMIVTKREIRNNVTHIFVTYRNGGPYSPVKDLDITDFSMKMIKWKLID